MKKVIIIIVGIILLLTIVCSFYFKPQIYLKTKIVEINKEFEILDFISNTKNVKLKNAKDKVMFDKLGKNKLIIEYKNIFNQDKKVTYDINVVDTIAPIIEFKEKVTKNVGDKDDLISSVNVTDNSLEDITVTIEGEYDLNKAGTYELKYVASDLSGNTTKEDFTLVVNKKVVKTQTTSVSSNSKYYIKVNKKLNVLMVYGLDDNNKYTNLVRTFVVSTGGDKTPSGVFTTTDRYELLSLVGGVYGHYTIRITGPIWFHSVPYYSKPVDGHWDNLEYEEYNKLGTSASLGCIRLAVIDAKWLYENIPWHTQVEIYESDTLPEGVTKPASITIDINSDKKGWDPTDPDSSNPWNL